VSVMVPPVHSEEVVLDVHGPELLVLDVVVECGPQGGVVEAVQVSEGEHYLGDAVSVQVGDLGLDTGNQTVDIALDAMLDNNVEGLRCKLDR